jgi:hypothetical protein
MPAPMMFRSRLALKSPCCIVAVLIVGFGISTVRHHPAGVGGPGGAEQAGRPAPHPDPGGEHRGPRCCRSGRTSRVASSRSTARAAGQTVGDATRSSPLMIYRRNGGEAFTDMATRPRRSCGPPASRTKSCKTSRRWSARPAAPCPAPSSPGRSRRRRPRNRWKRESGLSHFTLHYPILNQEKCQGCHGSDHKVARRACEWRPRWSRSSARSGATATGRS